MPILGGLLWKRGTAQGALAAVAVGGLAVIGLMAGYGILANEPVYYGLPASLAAYVAVSLATRPTDEAVLAAWRERVAGRAPASESVSEPSPPVASPPGVGIHADARLALQALLETVEPREDASARSASARCWRRSPNASPPRNSPWNSGC
ncbi:hypothetical protein SALBM217S_08256 [Streptomyces griseoloalbus]